MQHYKVTLITFATLIGLQLQAAPMACEVAQSQKMSQPDLLKLTDKICVETKISQDPSSTIEEVTNGSNWTAEQNLIFQYSKNCYTVINPALYAPLTAKPEVATLAKELDRSLCDQKIFQGEVYRGMNLSEELAKTYAEGAEILSPSFTSTSKQFNIGCEFAVKGNALIKIFSKNGREIENLSHHPDEEEVLFRLNTQFKVRLKMTGFQAKMISNCKKVSYYIEMEEIN